MTHHTWADRMGLPTGVEGEYCEGIRIEEANRATVFEERKAGVEVLLKIRDQSYRNKNVDAVVFGIEHISQPTKYAVYVEPGFLIELAEDE